MANKITYIRILCSILMLFFKITSIFFFVLYMICGISDMLDGIVARRTKTASEYGAKIDTVADFVFIAAAFLKILPAINIAGWLWLWGAMIAIIKIGNIILGYVLNGQFVALHNIMNKVTGLILFLLPLTLSFIDVRYSFSAVCVIATVSAIYELVYTINI